MDPALLLDIGTFVVVFGPLAWVASKLARTPFGDVLAFVCCLGGAYAIATCLEVCAVQMFGTTSMGPSLLAKWGVLGTAGFVIATMAKPNGWLAMVPCCIVGAAMMLHGPLTADPATDLGFGSSTGMAPEYPPIVGHVAFFVGMVMLFFSVIAGMIVGVGRDPPVLPVTEVPTEGLPA